MFKKAIFLGVLVCAGVTLGVKAYAGDSLKSPFDVAKARSVWQSTLKDDSGEFVCPPVPAPAMMFEGVSRYCDNDKSRSIVCPEKEEKYESASKNIDAFNVKLVNLANRYVHAKKPRPEVAQCALAHLTSWAKAGAWLPDAPQDSQIGEYKRGVSLGAMAVAYQLIQSEPSLSFKDKKIVEAWLKGLARPLMAYADDGMRSGRKSSIANHRYWHGLAVAQLGIATQDKALFEWGIQAYAIGMGQVQPNGVLPLELKREKKGFGYHLFAMQPLILLERIMRVNGYDPEAGEMKGKLANLVKLIVPMIRDSETKNAIFVYKDPYEKLKNNQLAWLEVYLSSHPDVASNPTRAEQIAIIRDRRNTNGADDKDEMDGLNSTMAGGDMTFFFGQPKLPR